MNKSEIIERLAEQLETSKAAARRLLDSELEAIAHELAIGNRVVLRGLGTFETREVPAQRMRRPSDGEWIEVAPRRQVTFRASEGLRDGVQAWEPPE